MTGSLRFSLEATDQFNRTFRRLAKSKAYGNDFKDVVGEVLRGLLHDPYPSNSRDEPLPRGTRIPEPWTFHKLTIKIGPGASGQLRLVYLVNETDRIVKPLWIYSHEQFKKRPPDREIHGSIKEVFED